MTGIIKIFTFKYNRLPNLLYIIFTIVYVTNLNQDYTFDQLTDDIYLCFSLFCSKALPQSNKSTIIKCGIVICPIVG